MAQDLTDKHKNSKLASDNILGTSEYISATSSPSQPWLGVLTIGLLQGNGFSIPEEYRDVINSAHSDFSLTPEKSKKPWTVRRLPLLPYAIIEYDKFYAYAKPLWGTMESPEWSMKNYVSSIKFDVSRAAELVLWFYLENPNAPKGTCDFFLGKARVGPILEETKFTKQLQVEGSAAEICLEIEYTKTAKQEITESGEYLGKSRDSDYYHIFQTKVKDMSSHYANRILAEADSSRRVFLSQVNKPFIAPLKFVAQTSKGLQLLSPYIHGGPLFYHLQKQRRFDVDRCRFYGAEILCAFESLLQSNPSYLGPKTENILLDSLGHVVLCDFSLFDSETKKQSYSAVEYPAPELLLDENCSTEVSVHWWWTLGVFLYEMLTGMSPFYAATIEEVHEKIKSSKAIEYPNSLPLSAVDILARLLDRNPEQRLGAKQGVTEIKEHLFFDGIDWIKLSQREYHPAFKPPNVRVYFEEPTKAHTFEDFMGHFKGFSYNRPAGVDPVLKQPSDKVEPAPTPAAPRAPPPPPPPSRFISPEIKITVDENRHWELVWEEDTKVFYFYNRTTNTRQPIVPQTYFKRYAPKTAEDESFTADARNLPTQIQKEDALEGVLKAGYLHMLPHLLHEYGHMDLNIVLYSFQGLPSPLLFAVEQENVRLLKFFIDEGAFDMSGIALIRAVKKEHEELITTLANVADRVHLTRALGRAVDKQNTALINLLLANGAKCDFEDSDRPPPPQGCCFPEIPDYEDYMPPLVRAVKLGNMELVQLLLSNGADANAGYHDLHGEHRWDEPSLIIDVTCGRVIQVAMELGHKDMVELLLEKGADIYLPQPSWQFHDCRMIPRAVYFRVMAGLREMEAERQLTSDSDDWELV